MGNSMDSMVPLANGINSRVTVNGYALPAGANVYPFKGTTGYYQIQVVHNTMPQQRLPPHVSYTSAKPLCSYRISIPQMPFIVTSHAYSSLPGLPPYGQQQMFASYTPVSVPVHQAQKGSIFPPQLHKSGASSVQDWRRPAKPLHLRKPAIVNAAAPQIVANSPKMSPPVLRENPPVNWTRQPPARHFRKPIISRTVEKKSTTQKVPDSQPVQKPQIVQAVQQNQQADPVVTLKTMTTADIPAPPAKTESVPAPVAATVEGVRVKSAVRRSYSSLPDVVKSKKRIVHRFNTERLQYRKKLAAHNRMIVKTIKAFASGNNERGNQLMVKTNESFGALNRANNKMMEAQREAFQAISDVDMVHTNNVDEPIPPSFLKFQQQVQAVSGVTAHVAYYLRENLQIPVVADNSFQQTWCRLGIQLFKASKGLDE